MTVLVRDQGFASDDWRGPIVPLAEWTGSEPGVDVAPGDDLAPVEGVIAAFRGFSAERRNEAIPDRAEAPGGAVPQMIRVAFAKFSDGRGFTIARRLRRMGYIGRLRAAGHVIADQYAMARRSGFDEVEIEESLAQRQPEPQWLARADWRAHDHRSRLGF